MSNNKLGIEVFKMLSFNEKTEYKIFKESIRNILLNQHITALLNFNVEDLEMSNSFSYDFSMAAENMIAAAQSKLGAVKFDEYTTKELKTGYKEEVSRLSKTLSFESEKEAKKNLPYPYKIINSRFYAFLNYAYYSLLFLEPKIEKRFEMGYLLCQRKIEVGNAGYSEKLGKDLPYYFTWYGKKVIYVNPITGQAEIIAVPFTINGLSITDGKIVVYGENVNSKITQTNDNIINFPVFSLCKQEIANIGIDGGLDFLQPFAEVEKDLKQAERQAKRAAGKKVKETPWLSLPLGIVQGSNRYIRVHTLICLMVYGIDVVKFALMEGNSILTVDHKNSRHDDNRIDNLDILTRSSNKVKGGSTEENNYYFDYSTYMYNSIEYYKDDVNM